MLTSDPAGSRSRVQRWHLIKIFLKLFLANQEQHPGTCYSKLYKNRFGTKHFQKTTSYDQDKTPYLLILGQLNAHFASTSTFNNS